MENQSKRDKLIQDTKRSLFMAQVTGMTHTLFELNQEYTDCLNTLTGKELSINNKTFVLTKWVDQATSGTWLIEHHGAEYWSMLISVSECYRDGIYGSLVQAYDLLRADSYSDVQLLEDLTNLYTHILCNFHPDGRPLFQGE